MPGFWAAAFLLFLWEEPAQLLRQAQQLAAKSSHVAEAYALAIQARDGAHANASRTTEARAELLLAALCRQRSRQEEAIAHAAQGYALARAVADRALQAESLSSLGLQLLGAHH